ncbi:MAG: DUF4118 domain-containing protein [Oscillospiraceae bacterium]|nr:DUF4118 domain-containing protein [Oscillospiraceae bacterium]
MTNDKNAHRERTLFPFSWHDLLVTVLILCAAFCVSFLLTRQEGGDRSVPMLFILAVFLISRYTDGYLFGTASALFGVILVNCVFTYPYFKLNFTISGYPVTFLSLFATSVMTSTLTTQAKQREAIRLEAEREKMRGNLLRAVSHDLRTPLTSIMGTISALLENGERIPREKQRELLQESRDDAAWLVRMVENLLSITRMNGEEAKIQKTEEAVEEVVGESVRKFQKRFPETKVAVSVPEALLMVPMDAILIEQVLINLLENAILHGKAQDGIGVSVTAEAGLAAFTVSDEGVGIPEDAFAHLFDGYLSGDEEQKSESKRGMGIGLSVCQSIVKAHGGMITAENRPGGGALFRFMLPLKEGEE